MLNPSMHYAIETFGHDMRALGNAEGAADACRDCLDIQTDQTVDVAQRVFRTCRHHSARIAYASSPSPTQPRPSGSTADPRGTSHEC